MGTVQTFIPQVKSGFDCHSVGEVELGAVLCETGCHQIHDLLIQLLVPNTRWEQSRIVVAQTFHQYGERRSPHYSFLHFQCQFRLYRKAGHSQRTNPELYVALVKFFASSTCHHHCLHYILSPKHSQS
ncbi:hypothetical protein D3C76_1427510 [compost metagenome]